MKIKLLIVALLVFSTGGCSSDNPEAIKNTIKLCEMVGGTASLETRIIFIFSSVTARCEWRNEDEGR